MVNALKVAFHECYWLIKLVYNDYNIAVTDFVEFEAEKNLYEQSIQE